MRKIKDLCPYFLELGIVEVGTLNYYERKRETKLANSFDYLDKNFAYFDSACQSLRPNEVIDSLNEYYREYNSCGERVKYNWGKKVDSRVAAARAAVLNLLKLRPRDYFVSFTLNTTYGINLLLSQLDLPIDKVISTDIEHNSVFVPTQAFAKHHNIERVILSRENDGSINLNNDFSNSLVIVNAMSNIDGRTLTNIKELVKKVKKSGGFIIIDAAQALGSNHELLQKVQADAICSSAHKMYSSSLGIMVVRKDFAKYISPSFLGGGQVADVDLESYKLLGDDQLHTLFESGLQAWGEIIALGAAIEWLKKEKKGSRVGEFSKDVFDFLSKQSGVEVINTEASSVISFYHKDIDAHLIAKALSNENIMVRSGYFCCHYYLKNLKGYPHLVRISLGLHNTPEDIAKLKDTLERIFN